MSKKLLFAVALLVFATQLPAQITLNYAGYTGPFIGIDSLKETLTGSIFPNLAPAANATWDMDTCSYFTETYLDIKVASTTGAQFADSTTGSFGGFPYLTDVQKSVTSNGYVRFGQLIKKETINLSTLGIGDSVVIDSQYMTYSTPDTLLKLPATYLTAWQTHFVYQFYFHLTYIPVYAYAPGFVKSYEITTDSVVGWGKMRVVPLSGTTPSSYFNVLQVKNLTYVVDSFFINGTAAPALVLSAFSLSQGMTDTFWEQNYYRMSEIVPLAYVSYNSNFGAPQSATTHGERLKNVSVQAIANDEYLKIYPNPAINRTFTLELPTTSGTYSYQLTDMEGRPVLRNTMTSNRETITIPSGLSSAIYFLTVFENGRQYCVRGIDVTK